MSASRGDIGVGVRRATGGLHRILRKLAALPHLPVMVMAFGVLVVTGSPALAAQDEPARATTGAVVQETDVPVEDLEVGDCFVDPGATETALESIRVVPCSMLHNSEVFHTFDLTTDTLPKEEQLGRLAHSGCVDGFEGYVGETYDESPLEIQTFTPTEESWAAGDREVICAAYEPADAASSRQGEESESLSGPVAVAMLVGAVAFAVLAGAAMWRIFTKAGEAGWKSFVPVWNLIVFVRIARRPRWWLLLFLVPVANVVIMFPIFIAVARAFGKGVGFGIGLVLLGPVFFPILAFGGAQYIGGAPGEPGSSLA